MISDFLEMPESRIVKVISGGQTGADQGGLEAARMLGIPTGGTAPKGFKTEMGLNYELCAIYGLNEHTSPDYPPRTKQNVRDSDVTILVGNQDSRGSILTANTCIKYRKPYFESDRMSDEDVEMIAEKIKAMHKDVVLNVAGNRESLNRGIYQRTIRFVTEIIKRVNNL